MPDIIKYRNRVKELEDRIASIRAEHDAVIAREANRFSNEKEEMERNFDTTRTLLLARLQERIRALQGDRAHDSMAYQQLDDSVERDLFVEQSNGEERDSQLQAEVNRLDRELEKLELKYDQMDKGADVDGQLRRVREELDTVSEQLDVAQGQERKVTEELSDLNRILASKESEVKSLELELEEARHLVPSLGEMPAYSRDVDLVELEIAKIPEVNLPADLVQVTQLVDLIKSLDKRRLLVLSETRRIQDDISSLRVEEVKKIVDEESRNKMIEYMYKKLVATTPADARKFDHLITALVGPNADH